MVRAALLALVACVGLGCSAVLDPDDLRFEGAAIEADVTPLPDAADLPDDAGDVAADAPSVPDPGPEIPDGGPAMDLDQPDFGPIDPDTGPAAPVVILPGASCNVYYQVDEGKLCDIALPKDCATACGGANGWEFEVGTDAVGGHLFEFEVTGGFTISPPTSSLPSQLVRVQFGGNCGGDPCGDPTQVNPFKVLVTLNAEGQVIMDTLDLVPFRNDSCPATTCK